MGLSSPVMKDTDHWCRYRPSANHVRGSEIGPMAGFN